MLENISHELLSQCKLSLDSKGFTTLNLTNLITDVYPIIFSENWENLDLHFKQLTSTDGELFKILNQFEEFNEIEFIISIRDSQNEWEEDGIWHDDGSRPLAFTLSLTTEKIIGGELNFKVKNSNKNTVVPTQPYGTLLIFKTGTSGYEHKVNAVTQGKRIIIAGWCS